MELGQSDQTLVHKEESQNPPPVYEAPRAYDPYSQPGGHQGNVYTQQPGSQYMANPALASHSSNSNTTVIVQQPQAPMIKPQRLWATGLTNCCDDMAVCLCGAFCGTCLISEIAQDLGESACVPCCVPGAAVSLRLKWRVQENISGSLMDDCCTIACCGPCAMCQLKREIKLKRDGVFAFNNQMQGRF